MGKRECWRREIYATPFIKKKNMVKGAVGGGETGGWVS